MNQQFISEYNKENIGKHILFMDNNGKNCDKNSALVQVVFYERKQPEYFVLFYENGHLAGSPINPRDTEATQFQSHCWKKVRKEDCELYLRFLSGSGNYNYIQRHFLSRY